MTIGDALCFAMLVAMLLMTRKVSYWLTIAELGFKFETPLRFLTHSWVYILLCPAAGLASIACGILLGALPWWVVVLLAVGGWHVATAWGRSDAVARYRDILRELARVADEQQRQFVSSELRLSGAALLRRLREDKAMGL